MKCKECKDTGVVPDPYNQGYKMSCPSCTKERPNPYGRYACPGCRRRYDNESSAFDCDCN